MKRMSSLPFLALLKGGQQTPCEPQIHLCGGELHLWCPVLEAVGEVLEGFALSPFSMAAMHNEVAFYSHISSLVNQITDWFDMEWCSRKSKHNSE